MTTPAEAVRDAIEGCHRAAAAARLQRWRDPSADEAPADGEYLEWLASDRVDEACAEALDTGEIDAEQHAWLGRHARAIKRDRHLAAARRRLRAALREATLPGGGPLRLANELGALALSDDPLHRAESGRALERAMAPAARRFVHAHIALERVGAPKPGLDTGGIYGARTPAADAPAKKDALVEHADAFLRDTADAAEDAVRWCVRGLGPGSPLPWHTLVRGLRARDLDAPQRARDRFRHAAGAFRRLGFEDDMNARMRAEVDRGGALPFAALACMQVPRDVRVAHAGGDWGVVSDVCAASGVGRALGIALALRTLPVELRWPLGGCVPGAFGVLASGLWADRTHLTRVQGLTRPEAERVARVAGAFVLLTARFSTAVAVSRAAEVIDVDQRMELLAGALREALHCDVPPTLAGLFAADLDAARDRAHEQLAGLALAAGLRDRFDEDWFMNHRAQEPLRGAGQRGNTLSLDSWCEETGVTLARAAPRAVELVA